jgi:hypothetical protein
MSHKSKCMNNLPIFPCIIVTVSSMQKKTIDNITNQIGHLSKTIDALLLRSLFFKED